MYFVLSWWLLIVGLGVRIDFVDVYLFIFWLLGCLLIGVGFVVIWDVDCGSWNLGLFYYKCVSSGFVNGECMWVLF